MTAAVNPTTPSPGPPSRKIQNRVIALLLLLPAAGVLVAASSLQPAAQGMGTHTQLGMTPCGFLTGTGFPCATCGMTTAFSHAAHGDLIAAAATQPAGALMALLTAALVVVAAYAVATGISLEPLGRVVWRPRFVLVLAGIVVLAWLFTIARTLGA